MKLIKWFEVEWGEGRANITRIRNDVVANTWLPLPIFFLSDNFCHTFSQNNMLSHIVLELKISNLTTFDLCLPH
jgi:hypothetical protein